MRARIVWNSSSLARTQRVPVVVIRLPAVALRTFTNALPLASGHAATKADNQDHEHNARERYTEEGAMSRRLAEMTADSIESGGSSAAKNVEEAGFSEELKKQLESRIADSAFRNQNQRAFAEAEMPVCSHSSTSGIFVQILIACSPQQAKVHEIKRQPNHGPAPSPSMIPLYECLTTATNVCVVSELHASLSQPIYVQDRRNPHPLVNDLLMRETELPSMPQLFPTR